MLVKICGINDEEFLRESSGLNFDFIGFIFYPGSKRFVNGNIDHKMFQALAPSVRKVGVFVNEPIDSIIETAKNYSLDFVQLHGDESSYFVKQLSKRIAVIKAFRIDEYFNFDMLEAYEKFVSYFLFDTKGEQYGGTGIQFNWDLLSEYKGNIPFLLSGGIGPDDVQNVKSFSHPHFAGIDINSRFETEPGKKDTRRIADFLKELS